MPLMKTLTFNIICTLIFGIERGPRRDVLIGLFQNLLEGILAIPVNLPFTRFNRSLKASAKIRAIVMDLISEKRVALEEQRFSSEQDLITCLLSIRNEDNSAMMSDEEILDNAIIVMIAGHDTSSVLLTFFVRLLANDSTVRAAVVHGMAKHCLRYLYSFSQPVKLIQLSTIEDKSAYPYGIVQLVRP